MIGQSLRDLLSHAIADVRAGVKALDDAVDVLHLAKIELDALRSGAGIEGALEAAITHAAYLVKDPAYVPDVVAELELVLGIWRRHHPAPGAAPTTVTVTVSTDPIPSPQETPR